MSISCRHPSPADFHLLPMPISYRHPFPADVQLLPTSIFCPPSLRTRAAESPAPARQSRRSPGARSPEWILREPGGLWPWGKGIGAVWLTIWPRQVIHTIATISWNPRMDAKVDSDITIQDQLACLPRPHDLLRPRNRCLRLRGFRFGQT